MVVGAGDVNMWEVTSQGRYRCCGVTLHVSSGGDFPEGEGKKLAHWIIKNVMV
jgi:hypothetical protein